jgi:adenine-specific DNA-methyltransferase
MKKLDLLNKIKQFKNLSKCEKAYLINLINTKKKYGLIWEDKPEVVEEELRKKLPVLQEVKDKAIINDTETEKYPNHVIIEGDNLHALTTLTFTHESKIDAMYFDPPYNTGSTDWTYNNNYVDKEDAFKHSKWLSMMSKRLRIAKRLLAYNGIICVTIDDYEMPRLFILMEEIFGSNNHLGTIVIRNNPSGRSTVKGVSITHEYGLLFGKSESSQVGRLERSEKQKNRYDELDDIGRFEWVNFRKHGGTRKEATSMYYPFYLTESTWRIPEMEWDKAKKEWIIHEGPKKNETVVYPIDDKGKERRWKWGVDRVMNSPNEFCVRLDRKGEFAIYVKARMKNEGILPLTWWDKKEYSATAYGTNLLKEIFGELQKFSYPKSIHAVSNTLKVLTNKKDAIILDVFAGSGTTLHAAMSLNNQDGGSRQCILVSNNENSICEEVTYVRNSKIISGYEFNGTHKDVLFELSLQISTLQNSELLLEDIDSLKKEHQSTYDSFETKIENNAIVLYGIKNIKGKTSGLHSNNLRYFKTTLLSREPSLKNKKQLTQHSAELLCIKENCYNECSPLLASKQDWISLFTNSNGRYICVIYDDAKIEEAVILLIKFIGQHKPTEKIRVYVFSNGQYPYTEEFEDILDHVTLSALPDSIYKAYQNVLPKKQRELIPELEEPSAEETEKATEESIQGILKSENGSET